MNCKTCKHWKKESKYTTDSGSIKLHCEIIESSREFEGSNDGLVILVMDAPFQVFTGPDFGCVHHEPK